MCATIARPRSYRVTSTYAELSPGSRFNVRPGPVKSGQLCLFEVRNHLIVGRWYADVGGCDWIIQPKRWIQTTPNVRLIGAVISQKEGGKS
jgi:hypothetical protein